MRLQIWHLPMFPSLEKVPTVSCLYRRQFEISKWVSFIYGLGIFLIGVLALGELVCMSPLRVGSLFPTIVWFSWT